MSSSSAISSGTPPRASRGAPDRARPLVLSQGHACGQPQRTDAKIGTYRARVRYAVPPAPTIDRTQPLSLAFGDAWCLPVAIAGSGCRLRHTFDGALRAKPGGPYGEGRCSSSTTPRERGRPSNGRPWLRGRRAERPGPRRHDTRQHPHRRLRRGRHRWPEDHDLPGPASAEHADGACGRPRSPQLEHSFGRHERGISAAHPASGRRRIAHGHRHEPRPQTVPDGEDKVRGPFAVNMPVKAGDQNCGRRAERAGRADPPDRSPGRRTQLLQLPFRGREHARTASEAAAQRTSGAVAPGELPIRGKRRPRRRLPPRRRPTPTPTLSATPQHQARAVARSCSTRPATDLHGAGGHRMLVHVPQRCQRGLPGELAGAERGLQRRERRTARR